MKKYIAISAVVLSMIFAANGASAATVWTTTAAPSAAWTGLTSSSDGTHLAAVANAAGIYTSNDSGATWNLAYSTTGSYWGSIASSSDGSHIVAASEVSTGSGIDNGTIYVSSDYGAHWTPSIQSTSTPNAAPAEDWRSVAISSDGTHLFAISNVSATGLPSTSSSGLYISTDSGLTWTKNPQGLWYDAPTPSVAISSNGSQIAVANSNYIYVSRDGGSTWANEFEAGSYFRYITSSSDGTHLAAISNDADVYLSSDSGASWHSSPLSNVWAATAIVSSADGSKIFLDGPTSHGGQISLDSGTTWTNIPLSITSGAAAFSGNGNFLFVGYYPGGIAKISGAALSAIVTPPVITPVVTTGTSSVSLAGTSVILRGNLTTLGSGVTTVGFTYNPTRTTIAGKASAGTFAFPTATSVITETATGAYSQTVTGLTCGQQYSFRAVATDTKGGPANGTDATFTAPCKISTGATEGSTAGSATATGTGSGTTTTTTTTTATGTSATAAATQGSAMMLPITGTPTVTASLTAAIQAYFASVFAPHPATPVAAPMKKAN